MVIKKQSVWTCMITLQDMRCDRMRKEMIVPGLFVSHVLSDAIFCFVTFQDHSKIFHLDILHLFYVLLTGMMRSKLAWDSKTGTDYRFELLSRSPGLQYKRGRPSSHVAKSSDQNVNKRPTTVRTQRPRTSYILITVSKQCLG